MDKLTIKYNNNEFDFILYNYQSDKMTREIKVVIDNRNTKLIYKLYENLKFTVYFNLQNGYNFTLIHPYIKYIHLQDDLTILIFTIESNSQYDYDKRL